MTQPLSVPQSPALARVARGDLCAGCGACTALAPGKVSMDVTAPGYLRPVQSAVLSDAEETDIKAVCPGLGLKVEPAGRKEAVLWGPYVEMMTGYATDKGLRFAGASGGSLSAILLYLIDSGTVDAVVQTAASTDLPIGNAQVISTNKAGIQAAAGSRYAPSAPLEGINTQIDAHKTDGTRFAFVGKPCDAAAMRMMCSRNAAVAAAFPVIISFFCAGVPSHTGGREVLKKLGTDLEHTAKFRFRGNGWPGMATATDHGGVEREMTYHESWGKILNRHVQHRCKICADGTGMSADIVCADAWESDAAGYPVFTEAPGVSLIVARTVLGQRLIKNARAAGHIETDDFDVAGLAKMQPGQEFRRQAIMIRLLVLRLLGKPVPQYKGLKLRAAARQESLKRHLHTFFGSLRRGLFPKRP